MREKSLMIVGLNHATAPVELREKLAFEPAELAGAARRLRAQAAVDEAAIVSTCNRVEVVAVARDTEAALDGLKRFLLGERRSSAPARADGCLYAHVGAEAVRHLFRVAASLDSLVVGEPQILGQLKDSYVAAREAGAVGAVLHRLFHRSFAVAKRVRTETGIGSGTVSVSSIAVGLARRIFDRLDDKTVLLIGSGKMGELLVRYMQRSGARSLMVTNRTFESAVRLADEFRGNPVRFEDFPRYLKLADLVVGCTAAPQVILRAELVADALRERKQQAMFFIDLGVPRNFDARINELDNAYLYNIDDLKAVAQENLQEREQEAVKAEALVREEVASFLRWLDSLEQVPVIVALREKFEEIRRRELDKSLGSSLKGVREEERQAIEDMTAAIINKILHAPITRLKQQGEEAEEGLYADALKKLFGLEPKHKPFP
ncbi:MAG TPA: glutamyl-tRNA reductase [Candidatus Acidoferrales bacterium]|nr:glutamyl-tRNA reductase [Candidatus Acidoferrales bacterium]